MKKKILKYLITLLVGLALAAWVAISKELFAQTRPELMFAILSDSFFVPGVLIFGVGGMIFVSNEGMFDGISYGLVSFFDIFRKEKQNKYRTFYDYKQSKGERNTSFGFMMICGLGFIAASGIMYLLFNNYS